MKKFLIWLLAFIITILAAYYQRKTGPTYPQRLNVTLNSSDTELKLVRSLGLDERSEVKLGVADTSIKAALFYKRFKTDDEYSRVPFVYREYPVNSFIMNRIFKMTEERGFFALRLLRIPQHEECPFRRVQLLRVGVRFQRKRRSSTEGKASAW